MSQVRLTLRPPPNSEFVQGYPGVPPGAPDRPQATVKGALEVRTPGEIKAKWVRIELRKVETLPGGGLNNTYVDFVGGQPLGLWSTREGEEWGDLNSLDFPFSFRIPESLPPSLTLENGAGIKYELLASVCTKGKRNFFRRRKQNIITTQTGILVDKHELHSTWPIYCQHEAREIKSEGVTLHVERDNTCHGPGDRITVQATVKSDAMHTIILRGFELSLKESMIFRPGRPSSSKASAPHTSLNIIGESKLPVNATLFGGMSHKSELTCQVSANHTTTTLNSARHIDITYVLVVKALMGTGTHVVMDLPVILSNWPRNVSQEAVRRIGPAQGLSLSPPPSATTNLMSVEPIAKQPPSPRSQTFGGRTDPANAHTRNESFSKTYAGAGVKTSASVDEFGRTTTSQRPGTGNKTETPKATTNTTTKTTAANRAWPKAEEEKRLFNEARQRADQTQELAAKVQAAKAQIQTSAPAPTQSPPPQVIQQQPPKVVPSSPPPSPPQQQQTKSTTTLTPWPTAEQEKMRLFNEAQAAARRAQGMDYDDPPPVAATATASASAGSGSSNNATPTPVVTSRPSTGFRSAEDEKAIMKRYYEAKQAVERSAAAAAASDGFAGVSMASGPAPVNGLSGPVPYDSLYPDAVTSSSGSGGGSGGSSGGAPPPSFESSAVTSPPPIKDAKTALDEKMRLKKQYEMQDAAAARQQQQQQALPGYTPPTHESGPPGPASISSAAREKEMLRRKFEAQDAAAAAAAANATTPQPPPRKGTINSITSPRSIGGGRPTPTPPSSPPVAVTAGGVKKVISAAEEKALLKAKYDGESGGTGRTASPNPTSLSRNMTPSPNPYLNGNPHSISPPTSPPPPQAISSPPPLMPRPPVSYIQETQEEDARVSRFALEGVIPSDDVYLGLTSPNANGLNKSPSGSLRMPPLPHNSH